METSLSQLGTSSSPLTDILISLKQLIISLWFLGNAIVRASIEMMRFLIIWGKLITPYSSYGFRHLWHWISLLSAYLMRYMNALPWKDKVILAIGLFIVLLLSYVWRSGTLRKWSKSCRRWTKYSKRTLQHYWQRLKDCVCRVAHIFFEVLTIMMPAVTVILPLRLYVSRSLFRRLFTMATYITSACFSIKSLLEFYRGAHPLMLSKSCMSSQPSRMAAVQGRKSVLTLSKSERVIPKRKTVGEFGLKTEKRGLFSGNSLFATDMDDKNRPLSVLSQTPSGSDNDHTDALGVTVWLDYWVVASVFDLLISVPITLSRVMFRSYHLPIRYVQFGHIEEASISQTATSGFMTWWYGWPSNLQSWKWMAVGTYSCSLTMIYDITYSVLLMFVISRKHCYLVLARRLLVGLLGTCIYTLTGLQLIPVASNRKEASSKSSSASVGLLPAAWGFMREYFPPTFRLLFDALTHVPQILLLMLPSFLLRPAVFGVSFLYPLVGSLRSLENSFVVKQGYWLTYYTLLSAYETLLMRWLRTTPIWLWCPCNIHLELLFITVIQLLCLSPELLAQVVLDHIFSPLKPPISPDDSDGRNICQTAFFEGSLNTPARGTSKSQQSLRISSAPTSPIIKEEIVSEEYTPQRFMTDHAATVMRDRRNDASLSEPFTSRHHRRTISSLDEANDISPIGTDSKNRFFPAAKPAGNGGLEKDHNNHDGTRLVDTKPMSRSCSRQSDLFSSSFTESIIEQQQPTRKSFLPQAALEQELQTNSPQNAPERIGSRPRRTSSIKTDDSGKSLTKSSIASKTRVSSNSKRSSLSNRKRPPSRKAKEKCDEM